MSTADRAKGWSVVRYGVFAMAFVAMLHAIVWGVLAVPVYHHVDQHPSDQVGLVIISIIMGLVALVTVPIFGSIYISFLFFSKMHVVWDLLFGSVRVLQGTITAKRRPRGRRTSMYGRSFLTVEGLEYDTSLFSIDRWQPGDRVELRVGDRTGVLLGVQAPDG